MEPRGGEPSSLRHRAENHPVLEQLTRQRVGEPFKRSISRQDSCSLANSEKLITEEVGKGDGVVETDTSDTLTSGEGGSCGAGEDFREGRERLLANTFADPGVWWRSLYYFVY